MNRRGNHSFIIILLFLLGMVSLSSKHVEPVRGAVVAGMTPFWNVFKSSSEEDSHELERLRLENQLLYAEVERLQELSRQEHHLIGQLLDYQQKQPLPNELLTQALKREEQTLKLFDLQLSSLPGKVIYRPPHLWNSMVWIDVGAQDNEGLDKPVVQKNSPVVLGTSVVGVVDFVGKKQSRVRLISDPGLNPSVRVVRNGKYLAKGELRGTKEAMWRLHQVLLKGQGFNYDFADPQGPARDLRTGAPVDGKGSAIALVKKEDLLITTGMDGVFPPGLQVATVTKVNPLKEGDYAYELEAKPTAGDLNDLQLVFVLPAIKEDEED